MRACPSRWSRPTSCGSTFGDFMTACNFTRRLKMLSGHRQNMGVTAKTVHRPPIHKMPGTANPRSGFRRASSAHR
jgi:hypothetical protein